MVDTGAATPNSVPILRPLDHAECGNSDLDEFGLLSLPLSFGAPTRVGSGRPADVKPRSRLASGWGIILPRRSSKGPTQFASYLVDLEPNYRNSGPWIGSESSNFLRTQTRPRLPRCRGHLALAKPPSIQAMNVAPFPTAWTWRFRYCGASVARTGTSCSLDRPSRTNMSTCLSGKRP